MLRRRVDSLQSIWSVLKDARGAAIYRVEATGVRIKDCHSDSRLANGMLELRREGELARRGLDAGTTSEEWRTLDGHFDAMVAAVEVPDDAKLQVDRALVGASLRLEALTGDGSLRPVYVGRSQVGLRDLLRIRDVKGRRAGRRVACLLTRETASDLFSLRRRSSFGDWVKLVIAVAGAISGLGSLSWLLSQLL